MANNAMRKYGVAATIDFELYEIDGVDLRTNWVPAAADCEIMKDGGASTQCTNTATDEGSTYSIVLTATEMQAARLVLKVVDSATKVFLDKVVIIETYGNASAQHAFDFDTASNNLSLSDIFTYVIENSETFEQQMRVMRAESAGKVSVSGSTVTFRDAADGKNRIVSTTDSNGQRTAVTVDSS